MAACRQWDCHFVLSLSSAHEEEERAQYAAHFEKYEQRHLGGFTRIYPKDGNEEVYKNFFDQSTSLCSQTASSRARSEIAKQLREELEVKRKEQKGFLSKDKPLRQSKSESSGAESPPHMREQRMKLIASQVEASKRLSSAGHSAVVRRRGMSFRVPALQLTEDEVIELIIAQLYLSAVSTTYRRTTRDDTRRGRVGTVGWSPVERVLGERNGCL